MNNFKKFIKIAAIFIVAVLLIDSALNFAFRSTQDADRLVLHDRKVNESTVDTVFLGASQVYYGINPGIIDKGMGVNSFDVSSQRQSIKASYYALKDWCESTDSIDTVYLELNERSFDKEQKEYDISARENFTRMKSWMNKLKYLADGVPVNEWTHVFFYSRAFHQELREASIDTAKYNISTKLFDESYKNYEATVEDGRGYGGKGYWYNSYESPYVNIDASIANNTKKIDFDNEEAFKYFYKIKALCEKNDIRLICYTSPLYSAYTETVFDYNKMQNFYENFAKENKLEYYDFNLLKDRYKYFGNNEFVDVVHLNAGGATNLSKWIVKLENDKKKGIDVSKYFYDDYIESSKSIDFVTAVSVYVERENDETIVVSASTYDSDSSDIEYKFLFKDNEDDSDDNYSETGKYSKKDKVKIKVEKGKQFTVKVLARTKGSRDKYQANLTVKSVDVK